MSIKHVVPMMALLALPLAAQAQTRTEARTEARVEARVEGSAAVDAPSRSEKEAGAAALAAGATVSQIATVRDAAPEGRDLTASLSALAELRAAGMSGSRAAAQIASRLRAGASDRAITTFAADASAALELRGAAGLGGAGSGLGGGIGAGLGAVGSVGGFLR